MPGHKPSRLSSWLKERQNKVPLRLSFGNRCNYGSEPGHDYNSDF